MFENAIAIADVNFSDDDDDIEAIVNAKSIVMELAQDSSSKIDIYLSSPFYNSNDNTTSYIVIHGSAGRKRTPFYFYKGDIQQSMAMAGEKKFKIRNIACGAGRWTQYITNYKVRRNPHDEDGRYKRNEKGYPTEMFGYAVKVKGKLSNDDILREEMRRFSLFFQEPMKTESRALSKCQAVLKNLKESSSSKLYQWLVEQKGGDDEKAAQVMAKETSVWVRDGAIYHKKFSLDQFMVDYDIKQFLIDHLSCGGWEDLSDSDKKHCFKKYPRRQLPEWETVTKEDYVLGIKA